MRARRDPWRAARRREQGGMALLLTAILGVVLLGGWVLAWRATHDTIRAERYLVQRAERRTSVEQAMADAVLVLETGLPPSDPYECLVTYPASPRAIVCKVVYSGLGGDDWQVQATMATLEEAAVLPDLPASF